MEGLPEIVANVWHDYKHRTTAPGAPLLWTLLRRGGLFAEGRPIVDVAAGPSPHLLWHCLREIHEVYVNDWRADFLTAHQHVYRTIRARECPESTLRPYWVLGDPHQEPYLLTDRAVITHGVIPRIAKSNELILPYEHKDMVATLGGLFDARPVQVALYSFGEHPEYPESPSRVMPALDHLGVRYTRHDHVASADFHPRPDGTLFLITP